MRKIKTTEEGLLKELQSINGMYFSREGIFLYSYKYKMCGFLMCRINDELTLQDNWRGEIYCDINQVRRGTARELGRFKKQRNENMSYIAVKEDF